MGIKISRSFFGSSLLDADVVDLKDAELLPQVLLRKRREMTFLRRHRQRMMVLKLWQHIQHMMIQVPRLLVPHTARVVALSVPVQLEIILNS